MDLQELLRLFEDAEIELFRRLAIHTENIALTQQVVNIKEVRKSLIEVILQLKNATTDDLIINAWLQGSETGTLIQTNKAAVYELVSEYQNGMKLGRLQILRNAEDIYRKVAYQVVQKSTLGVDTRIQTAKQALVKFANNGITGFVDKSGREWDMLSYTETVTRTGVNNAFRNGKLHNLEANDNDLIIVRTSPRYCELCSPWRNKILSISGKSTKYPSLSYAKSTGLFHANCRCSFSQYTQGLTKVDHEESVPNEYEDEQKQREYERKIRKYRRILAVDNTNKRANNKLTEYQNKLKDLVDNSESLTRKKNRESIVQAR